jgi:hypothetical protein
MYPSAWPKKFKGKRQGRLMIPELESAEMLADLTLDEREVPERRD